MTKQTDHKPVAYHHGNLREALIEATLVLIESDGVEGFSLREVARQAGVSPRAPYQHFENRAALLAAIAQRGYELLGATLKASLGPQGAAGTVARPVGCMVEAYVEFARSHPAHFHVMFRPRSYEKWNHPEVGETGNAALAAVVEAVAPLRGPRASAAQTTELAVMLWAFAHGVASLQLEGALDRRSELMGRSVDDLVDRVTRGFESLLDAGVKRGR